MPSCLTMRLRVRGREELEEWWGGGSDAGLIMSRGTMFFDTPFDTITRGRAQRWKEEQWVMWGVVLLGREDC